jgi:hypothetical protein
MPLPAAARSQLPVPTQASEGLSVTQTQKQLIFPKYGHYLRIREHSNLCAETDHDEIENFRKSKIPPGGGINWK